MKMPQHRIKANGKNKTGMTRRNDIKS